MDFNKMYQNWLINYNDVPHLYRMLIIGKTGKEEKCHMIFLVLPDQIFYKFTTILKIKSIKI